MLRSRANENIKVCVCVCGGGEMEHNDGLTHDKTEQCSSNPKTKKKDLSLSLYSMLRLSESSWMLRTKFRLSQHVALL